VPESRASLRWENRHGRTAAVEALMCAWGPLLMRGRLPSPRELRLLAELEEAVGQVATVGLDIREVYSPGSRDRR
jgi:hypothetical protein